MVRAAPAARRDVTISPQKRRPKDGTRFMTFTGILTRVVAVRALGWFAGFVWFSMTLPDPAPIAVKTDAVVVLTGGAGRLARGLEVLEAGSARNLDFTYRSMMLCIFQGRQRQQGRQE